MGSCKMDQTKYKKSAASSYIINFYDGIITLTQNYTLYNNLLIESDKKYGEDNVKGLTELERQQLLNAVQNIRSLVQQVYIQYKSIASSAKVKEIDKIEDIYNKLKKDFIIKLDDLEKFVIGMNSFLVNEIIQELLSSATDLMEQVVGETQQTQTSSEDGK